MRIWAFAAVVAASSCVPATALAGDENSCHDSESNREWAKLAQQHHRYDDWQRLFALRVGLCVMVEQGELSVGRASDIFERERKQAIEEIRKQGEPKFGA